MKAKASGESVIAIVVAVPAGILKSYVDGLRNERDAVEKQIKAVRDSIKTLLPGVKVSEKTGKALHPTAEQVKTARAAWHKALGIPADGSGVKRTKEHKALAMVLIRRFKSVGLVKPDAQEDPEAAEVEAVVQAKLEAAAKAAAPKVLKSVVETKGWDKLTPEVQEAALQLALETLHSMNVRAATE